MAAKKKAVRKTAKKAVKKAAKKATPKTVKKVAVKAAAAGALLGKSAPNFTMPTDNGGSISLKDLRGKNVVLYFYPKDDTPGCTVEACAFRDGLPKFNTAKAPTKTIVIGVSKDSVASHQKFKTKYKLNFPLASDDSGVCEAYGVWKEKNMYGRKYMGIERSTFIIDAEGVVKAEWRKVSVPGHADEVTKTLQML